MARAEVLEKVRGVFRSFGFAPIETPAIERVETLAGKYGEEGDRLIFRLLKRGGELDRSIQELLDGASRDVLSDIALRYDLTVPLARLVAQYSERIPMPFKRFHIAPVWRAEAAQKGRFREFYQCDIDTIGSADIFADAEIIRVMATTMSALGFDRYAIRTNSRKILDAVLEYAGVPQSLHISALRALDKIEKIGQEGVCAEMGRQGISTDSSKKITELMSRQLGEGPNCLRPIIGDVVAELASTLEFVDDLVRDGRVIFDPTIARGLDYYTGNIFETTLLDAPGFGSVMSGGRYDQLVGMFLGRDLPAVGASLGVDRLLAAMEELGLFEEDVAAVADFIVCILGDEQREYALRTAQAIRAKGYSVYTYPESVDLRTQLVHANKLGIKRAVIVGDRERQDNTVTVKDMDARTQRTVRLSEV